jgi:uncharacterized membrane protein YGL010W
VALQALTNLGPAKQLPLAVFIFYFLKYWVHGLLGDVVFEKISYIKNLKNTEEMMIF